MCAVLSSEDMRRIGASELSSQAKLFAGILPSVLAEGTGVSTIGDNHPKSTEVFRERVLSYPPTAAMGVTLVEKGDWPPVNNAAVMPEPRRVMGAGQPLLSPALDVDIGEPTGDLSGQKLAGVARPPFDIAVGVGSRLATGRFVRLSGAKGQTLVRHVDVDTFCGVSIGFDVGDGAGKAPQEAGTA